MPALPRRQLLKTSAAVAAATGLAAVGVLATAPEAAPASRFPLLGGGSTRTADLLGHVALVNFWATSCVTCVAEMPQFVRLHQALAPQGLHILAVAMHYDRPDYVANFARTRQLPFPVALDASGDAARQWGDIQATPTTFVLDRQGRIVQRIVGAPDFQALEARLRGLLA